MSTDGLNKAKMGVFVCFLNSWKKADRNGSAVQPMSDYMFDSNKKFNTKSDRVRILNTVNESAHIILAKLNALAPQDDVYVKFAQNFAAVVETMGPNYGVAGAY